MEILVSSPRLFDISLPLLYLNKPLYSLVMSFVYWLYQSYWCIKTRKLYKSSIHSEASNKNVPEMFMHNNRQTPSGCIQKHTELICTFYGMTILRNHLGLLCNLQHSCSEKSRQKSWLLAHCMLWKYRLSLLNTDWPLTYALTLTEVNNVNNVKN